MAPETWGAGAHYSGFTGDTLKLAKLLVKLKFTKEAAKPTVGNGLNIREDLEHLYDEMYKSFFQNVCKPGDGQKGVAISTMADIFLKILI